MGHNISVTMWFVRMSVCLRVTGRWSDHKAAYPQKGPGGARPHNRPRSPNRGNDGTMQARPPFAFGQPGSPNWGHAFTQGNTLTLRRGRGAFKHKVALCLSILGWPVLLGQCTLDENCLCVLKPICVRARSWLYPHLKCAQENKVKNILRS